MRQTAIQKTNNLQIKSYSNNENFNWGEPLKKGVQKIAVQQMPVSGVGVADDSEGGKTDVELENILKSENDRASFQQFLQQQFCAENLTFYLSVEEYRKIPESDVFFFTENSIKLIKKTSLENFYLLKFKIHSF